MILKNAVLHIMDMVSDVYVFSEKELDIQGDGISEFIDRHLEKIMADGGARKAEFSQFSTLKQVLEKYLEDEISFVDFSKAAAELLRDILSKADEPESMDFLAARFTDEAGEYIGLLLLPHRTAFTHKVINGTEGAENVITRFYAMLPALSQRISSYAVIDVSDLSVSLGDKKRSIAGDDIEVIADRLLQCVWDQPPKDSVNRIKKTVVKAAEEFGINSAIAAGRAKNYIIESSEEHRPFSPLELGEEVFRENEEAKRAFREKALEADIPAAVTVDIPKVVDSIRSHKIKTDTGIEIKIPVEFMENDRYVEFENNYDGTISIKIKNVGKIVNR